ncbi:MAG TPA: tRNA (adenosine(37)-N6)-threonylcarbamoyltransferase complex ATPase subunit type 1 TsaE [Adhaeribacter sp.]|nr:tRNA (adenosine(37)-N6)-threonylcarbamoyltransferase complex ATPase subunit type 1 TsaE [Adhaeribacter sp.]
MQPDTQTIRTLEINDLTDLPAAAEAVLTFLSQNPIVLFEGEMGAGKTTFIKAICQALKVTDNVSSPTFSIVNEYETEAGERVYHFDFYRINTEQEALDIGAPDYFDSGNICLIEWPERIPNLLPDHYLLVSITSGGDSKRTITLKNT